MGLCPFFLFVMIFKTMPQRVNLSAKLTELEAMVSRFVERLGGIVVGL